MNIKGREQKCLKSTIQFDPPTTTTEGVGGEEEEGGGDVKTESTKGKDGEVVGDGERSTLPFRDGIFASRAIRLLEVAAAQVDIPWFLAIGFSLPHEPIRVGDYAFILCLFFFFFSFVKRRKGESLFSTIVH
jgi:hypothetical protein